MTVWHVSSGIGCTNNCCPNSREIVSFVVVVVVVVVLLCVLHVLLAKVKGPQALVQKCALPECPADAFSGRRCMAACLRMFVRRSIV